MDSSFLKTYLCNPTKRLETYLLEGVYYVNIFLKKE